jgi:hypothetical protein
MKLVEVLAAGALACAMLMGGSAQAAQDRDDAVPGYGRDRHITEPSRATRTPAYPGHPHGEERHHRRRIAAIVIYVPVSATSYVPYYYAPAAPAYVDQEPPTDAYRDLNGFFYWCWNPAGYYPYVADCPVGWRLVTP